MFLQSFVAGALGMSLVVLLLKPNHPVVSAFNDRYLRVSFIYGGRKRHVLIERESKATIINIWNEYGESVFEEVQPYMGFGEDFFGASVTPRDFGYDRLVFENIWKQTSVFDDDQKIMLN